VDANDLYVVDRLDKDITCQMAVDPLVEGNFTLCFLGYKAEEASVKFYRRFSVD
jgi:hypothetical protein